MHYSLLPQVLSKKTSEILDTSKVSTPGRHATLHSPHSDSQQTLRRSSLQHSQKYLTTLPYIPLQSPHTCHHKSNLTDYSFLSHTVNHHNTIKPTTQPTMLSKFSGHNTSAARWLCTLKYELPSSFTPSQWLECVNGLLEGDAAVWADAHPRVKNFNEGAKLTKCHRCRR